MNPVDVDVIIDKLLEVFRASPSLSGVKEYYKVNGILPGKKISINIGCESEKYEQYTKDMDKGKVSIKIYISLENRVLPGNEQRKNEDRLEYGERVIRRLAGIVRQVLIDNPSIGNSVAASFPSGIEYVTAEGYEDLHVAVISLEACYFASRKVRSPITVNEIDAIFMDQRKIILKGDKK